MRTFKDIRESAKGMVGGFSVEIPKQTISGKTIGGGKNGIFVKAKTARQAISMAAKRLGVDFKMLKVGKVIKESVGGCECEDCKCDPCTCSTCPAPLDEAYQQFLDKTPNWGEDKAISYGRKKGYKEIGVVGYGKIDGIVLFGLDAGDKSYVGKEAKVKTGQTVFRYATSRTVAGDIFPLVKIDVKKGLLYHLSQKSSEGEIEHAEFETKSSKLRYLRLLSTANLRDITGFDPGFGSMKESVGLDEGYQNKVLASKGQWVFQNKGEIQQIKYKGKVIGDGYYDQGSDSFDVSWTDFKRGQKNNRKGGTMFDTAQDVVDFFSKMKITESVDLDEARQMKDPKKDSMVTKSGKTIVIDKSKESEYLKKGWTLAENETVKESNNFFKFRDSLNEKKDSAADLYFDTYSAAVQHAKAQAEKKGFEVVEDDWFTQVTTGKGKPGRGKTTRHTLKLLKNDKPVRKSLAIQVYNRDTNKNTYELNMYIS